MSERDPAGLDRSPPESVGGVSATVARLDRPRGPGTTFAVVADAHLQSPRRDRAPASRRTRGRLAAAVADADRLDVDAVLVAGDLTASGSPVEVELAERALADVDAPVLAVPGDRDLAGSTRSDTDPSADGRSAWTTPAACPFARRVGGVTVLCIDTATGDDELPTGARGGSLGRGGRSWLARTARADPGPTILLTHHAIAPLPEPFDRFLDDRRFRLCEPARTADVCHDASVDLAISGHLQWPTAAHYRGVDAVGAPSTSVFPSAYLLVDVEPRGTTVSLVPLADSHRLEADYRRALAEEERGAAVRAAVDEGYFRELPLVDRRSESPAPSDGTTAAPRRS